MGEERDEHRPSETSADDTEPAAELGQRPDQEAKEENAMKEPAMIRVRGGLKNIRQQAGDSTASADDCQLYPVKPQLWVCLHA